MNKPRLIVLAVALSIGSLTLWSQEPTQVQVVRNVNLRPGPSTEGKEIEVLRPPERMDLIEPGTTSGYYHVHTEEGESGWVFAQRVKPVTPGQTPEELAAAARTANAPVDKISDHWKKGVANKTVFHGVEGDCPAEGNGFDPDQYVLKNRTDVPTAYHDVTWQAIDDLDYPEGAPQHRKDWSESQLADIQPVEGVAVRVVGYLVAIKPQNGGSGEGTNCKFNKMGDVDFHLAVVAQEGDGEANSIVVEFTPRILKDHPKWTKARLLPWLDSSQPVRVSGWLMLDPDHANHIGKYRDTLWEIHPITKFEVFRNGKFVDLDSVP
jgi:hypothetical protein